MNFEQPLLLCDLFWKIWQRDGYLLPKPEANLILCFQLRRKTKQVPPIVRYSTDELILTCARSAVSMEELVIWKIAKEFNYKTPEQLPCPPLEELEVKAMALNACESAGWVILDCNFQRAVIPSHQHEILLQLWKNNTPYWTADEDMNANLFFDLVRTNISSHLQFLDFFPQWKEKYLQTATRFESFLRTFQQALEICQKSQTPQEFAKLANFFPFYAALFRVNQLNPPNLRTFMALTPPTQLLKWMKKAEEQAEKVMEFINQHQQQQQQRSQ
jgi:hypothetical protein